MEVTFVGSGDAFGSGGRLQACILLSGERGKLLVDCGATSLVGMKRLGIDPSTIEHVAVSHLHGDHFAGVPYLVLDGQFSRRERDLFVAGPPGARDRLHATFEALYPGSSSVERRFAMNVVELAPGERTPFGPATITAYEVDHASGAPPLALRIELEDKVIAYSGDTAWTGALAEAADGADLFIAEAYFFDRQVKFHLDYATLAAKKVNAKRIVLTHMSADMLARANEASFEMAHDGLTLTL
jgi:ribonuclease BN (tRNA processing enzyme)